MTLLGQHFIFAPTQTLSLNPAPGQLCVKESRHAASPVQAFAGAFGIQQTSCTCAALVWQTPAFIVPPPTVHVVDLRQLPPIALHRCLPSSFSSISGQSFAPFLHVSFSLQQLLFVPLHKSALNPEEQVYFVVSAHVPLMRSQALSFLSLSVRGVTFPVAQQTIVYPPGHMYRSAKVFVCPVHRFFLAS